MSDCCIKNGRLVILQNVKECGWETVPVLHWLHLSSLFFTLLSLSFFLNSQFRSYPTDLIRHSISMDGSSIQRHSLRSQFQAKNGNFVVLQSVSSRVAIFNYFCLQASLEKYTEKTLGPWQLFRGDLLHIYKISSLSLNIHYVFQCRYWSHKGKNKSHINLYVSKVSRVIIN